jgi:hypothetical protein
MTTRPPAKKQKKSDPIFSSNQPQTIALSASKEPARCLFFDLPNELIDLIVSGFDHPADMLSLARTSKNICDKLVGDGAAFMWRRIRKAFKPAPIPDPPSLYTESSWASFLFDKHLCAICGKKTFDLPWSFALRVHLCEVSLLPSYLDN